jgi:MYXO-CTERM domain-containing protein
VEARRRFGPTRPYPPTLLASGGVVVAGNDSGHDTSMLYEVGGSGGASTSSSAAAGGGGTTSSASGSVDAGVGGAGNTGGGARDIHDMPLTIGCGCATVTPSTSPAAWALIAFLGGLARRARRIRAAARGGVLTLGFHRRVDHHHRASS